MQSTNMIQEQKFKRKDYEKQRDIISVPLDKYFTRSILEADKKLLCQSKDATALKQLAMLGHKVIHDKKIREYLSIIIHNRRKNKRTGIIEYEQM